MKNDLNHLTCVPLTDLVGSVGSCDEILIWVHTVDHYEFGVIWENPEGPSHLLAQIHNILTEGTFESGHKSGHETVSFYPPHRIAKVVVTEFS